MRFVGSFALSTMLFGLAGCTEKGPIAESAAAKPAPTPAEVGKPADTLPSGTPTELLRQARQKIAAKDFHEADVLLEDVIRIEPTHREGLLMLAEVTQQEGQDLDRPHSSPFYLRSGETIRTLRAHYPEPTKEEKALIPVILYNEACTLALHGEGRAAVKALAEAFDAGFENIAQLDADDELDSIRDLPEFFDLRSRLEKIHAQALMNRAKPFRLDLTLPDAEGKPLDLSSLKGKVVLVEFWGSWASPSRKEVPHLVELYKKYHDKGLDVVGINFENGTADEAGKTLKTFIKEKGIPYRCVLGEVAAIQKIPGFEGLPTLLFLDRNGDVRLKLGGYQPLIALEAVVGILLDEKAEAAPKK